MECGKSSPIKMPHVAVLFYVLSACEDSTKKKGECEYVIWFDVISVEYCFGSQTMRTCTFRW